MTTTDRTSRIIDLAVGATIVAVALIRVVYLIGTDIDGVSYRISDDAYYYFNTARNICLGYGATFDRINPTNGFHPLWMVCVAPLYGLVGGVDLPLRIITILLTVMAALSAWMAYHVIKQWLDRSAALFALAVFCHPLIITALLDGLEAGLFVLLLFLLLWIDQRLGLLAGEGNVVKGVLLGALLGLIFLARLDAVFIVLATLVAFVVYRIRRPGGRSAFARIIDVIVVGCAFGVFVVPYIGWNLMTFGHIMPISGAIKSSLPHPTFNIRSFLKPFTLPYVLGLVGSVVLVVWAIRYRTSSLAAKLFDTTAPRMPTLLIPMVIGSVMHLAYEVLFIKWAVHYWHFSSYLPLFVLVAGVVFWAVTRRFVEPANRHRLILAALAVSVASFALDEKLRGPHHAPWMQAVQWVRQNTPDDSVFAMTDCGFFGYFSERRTVNLDGLINGYRFQEAVRDGQLEDFLRRCGVDYLVDYEVKFPVRDIHRVRVPARMYNRPGAVIETTPPAEVYRSEPHSDHVRFFQKEKQICYILWDYSKCRVVNMPDSGDN